MLDVIHYDNNKFELNYRVSNLFNRAKSIAYDWTTGKLYWDEQSSIRFTDESFKNSTNLENSTTTNNKMLIYPKQK